MRIRSITAPNPGPFTLGGTRSYLLGETVVIDPGPPIESHCDALLAAMPAMRTVLITHRHEDHAPAALLLKRRAGVTILAPPGVFHDLSSDLGNDLGDDVVTRRLRDGEEIDIEGETVEVIATPGHTAEHVCFLTSGRELFTGDTVLGEGTTTIFPPDGSMRDYLRSLQRLRALAPVMIHPGHGPSRSDALAWIDHYIDHRLRRESQVLEALTGNAGSVADIRRAIYPHLDPGLVAAAEIQIKAHLDKLREEGCLDPFPSFARRAG